MTPVRRSPEKLAADRAAILALCDGRNTIKDIAAATGVDRYGVWADVTALRRAGHSAPVVIRPASLDNGGAVYRHFDADGGLLYVGRTANPLQRTALHASTPGSRRDTTECARASTPCGVPGRTFAANSVISAGGFTAPGENSAASSVPAVSFSHPGASAADPRTHSDPAACGSDTSGHAGSPLSWSEVNSPAVEFAPAGAFSHALRRPARVWL